MSKNFSVDDFIEVVKGTEISGAPRPIYVDNEKQIVILYDRSRGAFFAVPFSHALDNPIASRRGDDFPLVGCNYYPLFVENIFDNVPEIMEFFNRELEERYCDSDSPYINGWKSQTGKKVEV